MWPKSTTNYGQVNVQVIDVETAETLRAEAYNHEGDFRSLLISGMPRLAALLMGYVPPPLVSPTATTRLTVRVTLPVSKVEVEGQASPQRTEMQS